MSSRIEQLIDDIEEYIDSCKFQPFSSNKIIVNKDDIQDLTQSISPYQYVINIGQPVN